MQASNRRLFFAAFFSLFGILAAQSLLETARDALFLAHMPVTRLPWMYLAMAIVTIAISRLSRRDGRLRCRRIVTGSLLLGAGVTAALGLSVGAGSRTAIYLVFLWSGIFAAFVVTQIWTQVGEALDMSQAKRLYGRLVAGGGLG